MLAKLQLAALGLAASGSTCDTAHQGSYTYTARRRVPAATTAYTVHTGNQ